MIKNIIKKLPHNLEWMVMFRISAVQKFADDNTIKNMYFLNPAANINDFDFVVLTSMGRFLYKNINQSFTNGENLNTSAFSSKSLFDEYSNLLNEFEIDTADSLATGLYPDYGKVVLHIQLGNKVATARSIFNKEPDLWFYEFLQAVGVKFIKGEYLANGMYMSEYENTLSKHISSGILANFSRTDNCNLFFFLHGNINEELALGLLEAGKKRLGFEKKSIFENLQHLAIKSMEERLKMQVLQPFGEPPFNMGDVVPKGFVYGALKTIFPKESLTENYLKSLNNDKLRGLWTFEKDDLETSVDSALVLMNVEDTEAAALLSKFQDSNCGAYLPQTDSKNPKEGDMPYVPEKDHWCQPDVATSALIFSILKRHKLPIHEKLPKFIIENFENRSDLYFANPYFVDWLYAQALKHLNHVSEIKKLLIKEILSSVGSDFSTGNFDKVFSTSCAILALKELGCEDNFIMPLQLYVLNNYKNEVETTPIPFYSSLIISNVQTQTGRTCFINGKKLSVYLYQDTHSMIYTSVVSLALNIKAENININHSGLKSYIQNPTSPRYNCKNHLEYVELFSLVNYL
jgi:hypothetical protein